MGLTDDAIAPGRRALAIASEMRDTTLASATNFFLATALATRGEFPQAVACYRAALGTLDGEATPERVAALPRFDQSARAWLAWALSDLGEFPEAIALGRQALAITNVRQDRIAFAGNSLMVGSVYLAMGDAEQAVEILEPGLKASREYNVHDWVGVIAMRLGHAYGLLGRVTEGIALLEEGAAHCERIKEWTNFPARLATLAELYGAAGRQPDAEATSRRAVALAVEQRRPVDEAIALRVLGRLTADEQVLVRARELADSLGMRPLVAHCHCDLGLLYRSAGKDDAAGHHLSTAESMYSELNTPIWLARMERLLGGLRSSWAS